MDPWNVEVSFSAVIYTYKPSFKGSNTLYLWLSVPYLTDETLLMQIVISHLSSVLQFRWEYVI